VTPIFDMFFLCPFLFTPRIKPYSQIEGETWRARAMRRWRGEG